ncbi:LuxR C-terminal-related transcriptional regulator [Emcibacter sp. SYSU 3D8]|uniref:helix-turn-helix transcriptional regulator n=1 Tax=Emcibacter sp. SYSU 3D8 TaxID=3133969 RepID=UPI0031FED447
MNHLLDQLLEELSVVGDDDVMREAVGRYLTGIGFAGFLFTAYGDNQAHVMCSCGQDLMLRYRRDEFHVIDPISRQARSSWLPVIWDVRDYLVRCTGKQAKLFEITLEHGYERGISVPVRGPFAGFDSFVGLSRHTEREFEQGKSLWRNELMLIGAHMSSVYHGVLHREDVQTADLTTRELECLHWTAQGKTAWEVARLIDISERTVQFHIRNACAKMNAVSKHQAALKAANMGLIQV